MTFLRHAIRFSVIALAIACNLSIADEIDRINMTLNTHFQNGFMGSVIVEKDGEVLLSNGYGQANLEWNIPNAPTTRFRIASITKQFTAASILILEEQGLLSTNAYVKDYIENTPNSWSEIKIFHLLNHSSGILDLSNTEEEYERFLPITYSEVIARHENSELDSAPGEIYNYSNHGYTVLGGIIEEVSELSYANFVQINIFDKLRMENSGYDVNSEIISNRASVYELSEEGLVNAKYIDMSRPYAAGSLYSTTQDLLLWTKALHSGEILSLLSVTKMTEAFKNSYGFGLISEEIFDHQKIWHNGGISGFGSVLAYYPDINSTILVLSNVEGSYAESVVRELEFIILGTDVILPFEHIETSMSEESLSEFVGVYEFSEGLEMTFSLVQGQLFSLATGAEEISLIPSPNDVFFTSFPYIRFEFKRDDEGKISYGILSERPKLQLKTLVSQYCIYLTSKYHHDCNRHIMF